MAFTKILSILLLVCVLLLMPARAACASERYLAVKPGESVEISNGDGTSTYFVLDPLATTQAAFHIDEQWWRFVYEAVSREVQKLAPAKYNGRTEDVILLLHDRPMDHLKIASLQFRPAGEQVVATGHLTKAQALLYAPRMFIPPEDTRESTVQGWFFWTPNREYDMMALNCCDSGEAAVHELAHAFTIFETTNEERERIAETVVESLSANEDLMVIFAESAMTLHLSAPVCVGIDDFLKADGGMGGA